jgi:hypothetical protein
MFQWLKLMLGGKAGIIRKMDDLEKPFADLIRKAQAKSGSISADGFSKELVDEIQGKLCDLMDVKREDVGLEPKGDVQP